jgi:propanol-preferring alcohol dehydrogenase
MRAMLLKKTAPIEQRPLEFAEISIPQPGERDVLIKVSVCGVCHTELDEIEDRLEAKLPVVPGHQVVGRVEKCGWVCSLLKPGDRVGVAWIYWADGTCDYCRDGKENLCPNALWTGKDVNGGYAEYMTAHEEFAYKLPASISDEQCAPLLCAGVIGYRALRLTGLQNGRTIALIGFGASAHILIQVIRFKFPDSKVLVLTRGETHQQFARDLGAAWAGSADDNPPELVDCAIDFTPAGEIIPRALEIIKPGGRVVVNAIRKETPIPQMDYAKYLWMERELKSTANVERRDAREFLELAGRIGIKPQVQTFALEQANEALMQIKAGNVHGAAVLRI